MRICSSSATRVLHAMHAYQRRYPHPTTSSSSAWSSQKYHPVNANGGAHDKMAFANTNISFYPMCLKMDCEMRCQAFQVLYQSLRKGFFCVGDFESHTYGALSYTEGERSQSRSGKEMRFEGFVQ